MPILRAWPAPASFPGVSSISTPAAMSSPPSKKARGPEASPGSLAKPPPA